jgi:transposase-like protein
VRRVEDITEALWGTRVSPSTVSDLNKKIYGTIEAWRNRPIEGEHPYVYLDGIVLKRSWAGEVRNVSLLVAIGVNQSGYREILGICEGAKEDKTGWSAFLKHLKERGLKGVRLITSDACIGLTESAAEFFPEAAWQRCIVGSLKKWPSRRLYAVAGSASVARIGQALGEGVQTEIGLNRANQRTKGAKRAAASRFKLIVAAVR